MEQAGDGDRRGITVPRSPMCVFAQGERGHYMESVRGVSAQMNVHAGVILCFIARNSILILFSYQMTTINITIYIKFIFPLI